MKILFSASPARGHIYPMLPLLRAAQADGHDVVLATAHDLAPELESAGIRTWSAGITFAEAVAAYRAAEGDGADLSPVERIQRDIRGLFGTPAAVRAEELVPRVEQWQPDLVVYEASEFAAPAAAAVAGARAVVHGLGLAPAVFAEHLAHALDTVAEPWGVSDLGARSLGYRNLDIVPPSLQLHEPSIWSDTTPLRTTAGEVPTGVELPSGFSRLLDGEVAYLTMGTLFNDKAEIFRASIAGLVELGYNVIVTTGPSADPDLLGPQPANVLVLPYVPQALVLPHVSLVVHHGGAGTTLGSFVHGLPQLIMPQGADQFMNAQAATAAGAARTLMPGTVSTDAVAAAAFELLDNREPRVVARRIQSEIAAMPGAGTVLGTLLDDVWLAA